MSTFADSNEDKYTKLLIDFTTDIEKVENVIKNIQESQGDSNYAAALSKVYDMLFFSESMDTSIKNYSVEDESDSTTNTNQNLPKPPYLINNVILFSDGLPTQSEEESFNYDNMPNKYPDNLLRISYYKHANKANKIADLLKGYDVNIYTLSFYQNLDELKEQYADVIMKDISNSGYSFKVEDIKKLKFVFGGEDTDPIIIIPGIMGSRLYLNENIP